MKKFWLIFGIIILIVGSIASFIFYPSLMVVIVVIAGLSLIKVKPAARTSKKDSTDEQIIYELLEDDNERESND